MIVWKTYKKRYRYSHTDILEVQSCHHTKKKSNKQQEHVDFPCQNRYNKYLQRKEEKTKQSKKEYSYLVVFC